MEDAEFRVIPVVRYVVTRHFVMSQSDGSRQMACTEEVGEFQNERAARRVCDAMIASGAGRMAQDRPARATQGD